MLRRSGLHLALVALLLPLQCAHRPAAQRDTRDDRPPVTLRRLSEGVWIHTSYARLPRVGWFPSSGLLLESPRGLLLVDTAWGLDATRELFGLIRARSLGNLDDADLASWPASALRVEARYPEAAIVVPSHGEPGDVTLLAQTVALARAACFIPRSRCVRAILRTRRGARGGG